LVGVTHGALSQLTKILADIENLLRDSQMIAKKTISVRLVAVTDSALNLEITALYETTDYDKFMEIRQGLLMAIVEVIERSGSALAHPMRSVEIAPDARAKLTPPPKG